MIVKNKFPDDFVEINFWFHKYRKSIGLNTKNNTVLFKKYEDSTTSSCT